MFALAVALCGCSDLPGGDARVSDALRVRDDKPGVAALSTCSVCVRDVSDVSKTGRRGGDSCLPGDVLASCIVLPFAWPFRPTFREPSDVWVACNPCASWCACMGEVCADLKPARGVASPTAFGGVRGVPELANKADSFAADKSCV
jgi:hypothetical protein